MIELFRNVTPSEARGLNCLAPDPDAIGHGVTAILFHEVLLAQILDSSGAEFILSDAERLLRNDMGRVEIDSYDEGIWMALTNIGSVDRPK